MYMSLELEIKKENFEDVEEKPATGIKAEKNKKFFNFYIDTFDGKYDKVSNVTEIIPSFKDFYYQKKLAEPELSAMVIIREFQEKIAPVRFFPYPVQFRRWRAKWDRDIASQLGFRDETLEARKEFAHQIKLRDERGSQLVPQDGDLEQGAQTLAGILLNDAQEQLIADREMEEIYSSDELIKRKNYALNVFTHITKAIQGNKVIAIKNNAEKRETAGFLMNILQRATAGKMSEEDLELLKSHNVTATIDPTRE